MAADGSTLVHGERRIAFAPEVQQELAERWLATWEDAFGPARRPAPGMPTKTDLAVVDCALGPVVLKRAHVAGGAGWLRRAGLRPTRATRAFALGRMMTARGVATPAPPPVASRRDGLTGLATCLIARFVEGEGPWQYVARHGTEAVERVLEALAAAVAGMHTAGFRHRDLKAPNLLLEEIEGAAPRVWILDLDGARECPAPPRVTTLRDLSRLAASFASAPAQEVGIEPGHWGRFVERYLEARHGGPPAAGDAADLAAETARRARRKIARNRRRGRPLA